MLTATAHVTREHGSLTTTVFVMEGEGKTLLRRRTYLPSGNYLTYDDVPVPAGTDPMTAAREAAASCQP